MTDARKEKEPIELVRELVRGLAHNYYAISTADIADMIEEELDKIADELEKARANTEAWRNQCARRRHR